MKENQKLFESGKFFLGCNWWASHAGTNMWHNWDRDVVEADIKRLAEAGVDVMRVFPLWNDFQPLRMHRQHGNNEREMRIGEDPLPFTKEGRAGIDPVMADRFEILCDIAEKYGVRLIVGLITGWMSGRMHAPEAFTSADLITDSRVVTWQIKFVKYMVERFKSHPAVAAWDLGNECNCLQANVTQSEAYLWASAITNAIKAVDNTRPVISGMHGTFPSEDTVWRAENLGEILDVLCTHPYPIFTPHCDTDPMGEMKSVMHSTAETLMYEGTSGAVAFVEEIGTLGPMISSEQVAGEYIRAAAISAWAHNLRGFVWWCANEQSLLTHTPYAWNSVERELGLFRVDGTKKPVLESMSELSRFVDSWERESLPERVKDAVVILTRNQDSWATAYGSFILAKQAGLDVEFAFATDEIPEAKIYIMPSMCSDSPIYLDAYRDLIERTKRGATLYMSIESALLSPFSDISGLKVITRSKRISTDKVALPSGEILDFDSAYKLDIESCGAKTILSAEDGTPALSEYKLGEGRVVFCAAPIELRMGTNAGLASGKGARPYYKIYELAGLKSCEKIASSSLPTVCVTEHIVSDSERILVVINYSRCDEKVKIALQNDYKMVKTYDIHGTTEVESYDGGFVANLEKDNGFVVTVRK